MSKLYRFSVEVFDNECADWEDRGSVLLPDRAAYSQIEHALACVGVYAPRGMDSVEWDCGTGYPYAQILDAGMNCIVRLQEISRG